MVTNERGGSVPSIDTRAIQTQVLVNNGQTVVLGGIYETEESEDYTKVPFLGDIPGVGALLPLHPQGVEQVGAADLRDAEDPAGRFEHLLRPRFYQGKRRKGGAACRTVVRESSC